MKVSDILLEREAFNPSFYYDIAEYVKNLVDWGSGDADTFHYRFLDDHPEYDSEYSDEYETPDVSEEEAFDKWILEHLAKRAQEFHQHILHLFHDGTLMVHRVITAVPDWFDRIKERGLGVYWAWDHDAAEAHWGENFDDEFHLVSRVTEDQINWEETIAQNLIPATEDEREINLIPHVKVPLIGLKKNGVEIDVSSIEGKLFPVGSE